MKRPSNFILAFIVACTAVVVVLSAFGQPPPAGQPIRKGTNNFVINPPVNFLGGQLFVDGVAVGGGGGGGGGGGSVNGITLNLPPSLFNTPVIFGVTGGVATGDVSLSNAPAGTVLSNLGGSGAVPVWSTISQFKTAAALNLVNNTSDLGKPISTLTQTALDLKESIASHNADVTTLTNSIATKADATATSASLATKAAITYVDTSIANFTGTSNITTVGTITTGVWHGSTIANTYLPPLDGIGVPTGNLNVNGQRIISLANPVNATDGVNKQYADSVANAGPPHPAVAAASTGNLTLSGEQTIDGVATTTNRILVKNQTTASENGIYVTAAGAWTRATDADTGPEIAGSVFVTGGTNNPGTTWGLVTPQPITINTDPLAYTQTGANTVYTAGAGLSLSGSQFSIANLSSNGRLLGRYTTGAGSVQEVTIGSGLALNNTTGVLTATGSIQGFSSGNLSPLFTTSVANSTGPAPALSFALSNAAANSWFGNATGSSATPTFNTTSIPSSVMPAFTGDVTTSAGSVATSIGTNKVVTTMLAQAPALTVHGNNTGGTANVINLNMTQLKTMLSLAESDVTNLVTDLAGKVPVTRSINTTSPISGGGALSGDLTLSMSQSSSTTAGWLSAADFITFNNKVGTSRTISTTTPLTGGGNLSANLTIAMPAATDVADGYLTATDHARFNNTSPVAVLAGNGSTPLDLHVPQTPLVNSIILNVPLTSPLTITLPPSSSYGAAVGYRPIEIIDQTGGAAMASNGVTIQKAAGDTSIDGGNSIQMPRGSTYLRLNPNGSNTWTSTRYFTTSFQDSLDPNKQVVTDVTAQPSSSTHFKFIPTPAGDGGTVPDTPEQAHLFVTGYSLAPPGNASGTGQLITAPVNPTDLTPNEEDITATTGTWPVTADGTKDSVKLTGSLATPMTVVWPPSSKYLPGTRVYFYDASGSISQTNTVTVTGSGGDVFNNGPSTYVINQQNGSGVFIADSGGWNVAGFSTPSSGLPDYQDLQENNINRTVTWILTPGQTNHTASVSLSGDDALNIQNVVRGTHLELTIIQDATGGRRLFLPSGSTTPSRTVNDGATTNTSTTATSQSAIFTNSDVGRVIIGAGIPASTTISSVTNSTTVVLSAAATATASNVTFTIKGTGIATIALGANQVTKLRGTYYGLNGYNYGWETEGVDYTAPVVVACSGTGDTYGNWSGSGNVSVGAGGANTKIVATAGFTPSVNTPICKISAPVYKTLNPTGDLFMRIYNNDGTMTFNGDTTSSSTLVTNVAPAPTGTLIGRHVSGTGIPVGTTVASEAGTTVTLSAAATQTNAGTALTFSDFPGTVVASSSTVLNANITETGAAGALTAGHELTFSFSPAVNLSTSNTYWVAMVTTSTVNSTNYFNWCGLSGQTSAFQNKQSADGSANSWTSHGVNVKADFKTFH